MISTNLVVVQLLEDDVGLVVGGTEVLDALVSGTLDVGAADELDWLEVGNDGVPVPQ